MFHTSISLEILEIQKYGNLKILEILYSKIIHISRQKYTGFTCMYVCGQISMGVCLTVCMSLLGKHKSVQDMYKSICM